MKRIAEASGNESWTENENLDQLEEAREKQQKKKSITFSTRLSEQRLLTFLWKEKNSLLAKLSSEKLLELKNKLEKYSQETVLSLRRKSAVKVEVSSCLREISGIMELSCSSLCPGKKRESIRKCWKCSENSWIFTPGVKIWCSSPIYSLNEIFVWSALKIDLLYVIQHEQEQGSQRSKEILIYVWKTWNDNGIFKCWISGHPFNRLQRLDSGIPIFKLLVQNVFMSSRLRIQLNNKIQPWISLRLQPAFIVIFSTFELLDLSFFKCECEKYIYGWFE